MEKINVFPRGLLDLLQIKGGKSIENLTTDLRPVIEMLDMYGAEVTEQQIVSTTIVAANWLGSTSTLSVPDDEFWFVFGASASALLATIGDTAQFQVFVRTNGQTLFTAQNENLHTTVAAFENPALAWTLARPWVLTPGSELAARVLAGAVTADTVLNIVARIIRVGPAVR